MTQQQCVNLLRELRGIERVIAAVHAMLMQPGAACEWTYAAVALDDRRRWLTYCLSLEHGTLIDSAELILDADQRQLSAGKHRVDVICPWANPPGSRIH